MFILYLTGGIGEDGKSWCPPCNGYKATIEENVINLTQLTVLKGYIEDRNEWVGVSTHPFKTHPIIKAIRVPSLFLCQGQQILVRAETDEVFENPNLL